MSEVYRKAKRERAERLKHLKDRYANEDMPIEERCELREELLRLERRASMRGSR